jgi:outer membrane receptor protein involved in Fe transport
LFKDTLIAGVREGKMPDQPELITNLTLGYDYKGFSSRLSFIYQKRSSQGGLSGNPLNDRFTSDYYRYDLSVKQKVNASLQVYLNISNLNNRADRSYQYQTQYPTFVEYYGTVFDLGLRYTFK